MVLEVGKLRAKVGGGDIESREAAGFGEVLGLYMVVHEGGDLGTGAVESLSFYWGECGHWSG